MLCKKCKKSVPHFATMCNHCYQKTGYKLPTNNKIENDMFDSESFLVAVDKDKSAVRHRYLQTLNEYKNLKRARIEYEQRQKNNIFKFLRMAVIVASVLIFILMIIIGEETSFMYDWGVVEGVTALFVVIGTPLFFILALKMLEKIVKRIQKDEIDGMTRIVEIHNCKRAYYANNNVFGYIVRDHFEKKTDEDNRTYYVEYYAYYEVDKRNIASVGYDPYFAEYILYLRQPIFIDYSLKPTKEFRVQDVFDDTMLCSALSCDLPPKNIPF